MKRMTLIIVVLVLAIGCEVESAEQGAAEEAGDAEHLYAVLMYAEHCASCSMLDPTVEAVREEFEEEITFLRFDMSDEDTKDASQQLAAKYEIEALYREHEDKTGYLIVVSEDGEEELLRLSGQYEEAELRAEFQGLLDSR